MRPEDFKGILLAMLIILSLSAPLIFLGNNSLEIVHASPEGGSDNKPIQIKVKIFVLENRVITDNVINARIAEANDALRNSGIRLVRGPIYRGFPGNARSRAARDNVRKKVNENLIAERFKGIALIIAPERSINDNENLLGIAIKSKRESAIVADNAGTGMGIKAWAHEIGHVLCLDDVEDNENNIMNEYDPCTENQRFSPKQMENMKKKAENENLNLGIKENNENRLPCTPASDYTGDVENKSTGDPASDPGGIDICSVNTPFLSLETIGVEIISMSLMGRGDNLYLYYGLGLNTDDNLDTGENFEGLLGVDRIVHILLEGIFPFESPWGSSRVDVTNVENNDYTYVGPAGIHTFVETTRLLNPGPGIRDNVMDGVRASIPLDLLGPMVDDVPAIAVAMDLVNEVKDTLTFICKTTVPPAPWMSISSRTGKPGDNVQIMGGGFPVEIYLSSLSTQPSESFFDVFVTLGLGGTEVEVARTTLDEFGNFTTTFEVPNLPPGDYFLTAIDSEFNLVFLMFTVEQPWRGMEVTIDPKYQSGLPGVTLNYTVTVKNTGGLEDNYDLTISDNSGWGPTIWPTLLTVPAGENRTATLNVTIPTNAMGCTSDNIIVTATSRADNTVKDNDSCTAHATIVRGVNILISPSYQSGSNGATLDYVVTVSNTGNVEDTYSLTAADDAGWAPTVSPGLLTVPPWENRTATLSVTVPLSAIGCTNDNISVTAIGTGVSDSDSCVAHATIVRGVDVLVSPSYQSGARGSALSYTVTITNTGNVVDNYDLTVSDNSGWGPTVSPIALMVPAGENRTATLSVTVPTNAIGCTEDNVTVTATSQIDNKVKDNDSCVAHAEVVRGVEVLIYPGYQSGLPGATLTYTVAVTNTGNVEDNYALAASDNAGWGLIVTPTWLVLAPGTLGGATLSVAIPENALGSTEDTIVVTAVGTEVENSASCIAHVRKVPLIIPATIDIDPDTLNLRSRGKWITAYIELPEGYSVKNIDVSTVRLIVENKNVPAELKPISIGDQDKDGIADLMVKFDRAAVEDLFPFPGAYTGTITGQVAGIAFKGSDNIRVINPTRR